MSRVRHVVPRGDLVGHHVPATDDPDGQDSCACGPSVEHVPNSTDGDGWIYVHHSLDARETGL